MAELAGQSQNVSGSIDFDALRDRLEPNISAQTALIQKTYAITDKKMLMSIVEALTEGIRPLGNDGMVVTPTNQAEIAVAIQDGQAAPTSQELLADMEMVNQQRDAGRSTIEVDADLVARATAMALAMKDRGASPEQIEQAIGKLSGINLENLKAVLTAVEKNTDATNFSLIANEPRNPQSETQPLTLGALVDAVTPAVAQASTEPTFGNLMWGEKPKTVELQLSDKEVNLLAAALAGTAIAQQFAAALNNMAPSEQQGNAGQAPERDTGRGRFA